MTWFMPRALVTPNSNVGRYRTSGTTNVYVQNNYGCSTGGLWNGYYSRTASSDAGIPIMTDPRYSMPYNNCGIPSWLQKSMENNMLFSFVQGMFGSGGTYSGSIFSNGSGGGCFGGGCGC